MRKSGLETHLLKHVQQLRVRHLALLDSRPYMKHTRDIIFIFVTHNSMLRYSENTTIYALYADIHHAHIHHLLSLHTHTYTHTPSMHGLPKQFITFLHTTHRLRESTNSSMSSSPDPSVSSSRNRVSRSIPPRVYARARSLL